MSTLYAICRQEFDIGGELDINVLARLPGALQPAREGLTRRGGCRNRKGPGRGARSNSKSMREQEGEALRKEMAERIGQIEASFRSIENAAAGLVEAYRARLQKRIGELLNRNGQLVEIDPGKTGPGSCVSFRPQRRERGNGSPAAVT